MQSVSDDQSFNIYRNLASIIRFLALSTACQNNSQVNTITLQLLNFITQEILSLRVSLDISNNVWFQVEANSKVN